MEAARLFATISIAGANTAAAALRGFGGEVDKTQHGMTRMAGGAGQLAGGMVRLGAVATSIAVGGLAAAAKTGIDFEDAFAGVRKTVGGTKPELDKIYDSLRQLATRVPVSFTDLAAIATEAGALNVPANEIVHFTEVIARLSSATQGLTVEAATEAVGKLGNILHVHGNDVDRFASSLVALGNAGASTEADIIETAKRFGAAGSAAKLSAAQVLGFSSAIASLGVEPEAAGSSLSRLFNKITLDIGTGNKKLDQFAKTAGLSTAAFSKLFRQDSTAGLMAFLKGLGKLDRFQVAKVLKDAGITNIRDVNAVLLLSQNYGLLADQVGVADKAFKENTALAKASAERFDTLKSHLTELWNTFKDGGEAISEGLNPAIGRGADKLKAFVLAHRADLLQLGKDLGHEIDSIDWQKVEKGAETFVDVLKTALEILRKIPPELTAAGAGLLALNKASGGLLVEGGANIVQGLGEAGVGAIQNLLAKKGGPVGGLLGSLGAQRVFVVNWPLGFGGGIPALPAAAEGAGATAAAGGLGLGAVATAVAVPTILVGGTAISLNAIADAAAENNKLAAKGLSYDEIYAVKFYTHSIQWQQAAIKHGQGQPTREDFERGIAKLQGSIATNGPAGSQTKVNAQTGFTTPIGDPLAGKVKDDMLGLIGIQRGVWALFREQLQKIHAAQTPQQIIAATEALMGRVNRGAGNVAATKAGLAELRAALKRTDDPKAIRVLETNIAKLEKKLAGREFIAKQLALAEKTVKSSESGQEKIKDLKAIQQRLLDRGDTHAAGIVGGKIDAEKRELKSQQERMVIELQKDRSLYASFHQTVILKVDGKQISSTILDQEQFTRPRVGGSPVPS